MIKQILGVIITGIIAVSGFTLFSSSPSIGVDLPSAPALFETSLAAPITDSATTLTLAANSVRGGGTLSGYNCFTIDEGSSQAEFVCGTVSGTSVTGLTRGVSPSDGMSEVSALQFPHRRGASVKITDFPIIQLIRAQNNGDESFENVLKYAASVVPSGADELADVGYVLSAISGTSTLAFDSLIVRGDAGETVATGTLVYFDATDQEWKKVDTDTLATYANVPVGLTQSASTDGSSISNGVLIHGLDNTQTGLTPGDDYYATSTAGEIDVAQTGLLVGRAKDVDELYFEPYLDITFSNNSWTGTNSFAGEALEIGLVELTAGETINGATLPVPVYASSTDSEVYAMDADGTFQQSFVGFAVSNSTDGNSILIQTKGVVDGFSSLDVGNDYFVQDTAGTIGSSIGTYSMLVGNAVSATEIKIKDGLRRCSGSSNTNITNTGSVAVVCGFRPSLIDLSAYAGPSDAAAYLSHAKLIYVNGSSRGIGISANGSTVADSSTAILYDDNQANTLTFTITSVTDIGFTISYSESGTFNPDGTAFIWYAEGY